MTLIANMIFLLHVPSHSEWYYAEEGVRSMMIGLYGVVQLSGMTQTYYCVAE